MKKIPRPENPEGFILISLIGKGSFAEVWLAKHNKTNINVAIKIISKKSLKAEDQKMRLFREIYLQRSFKHQYLASFYGIQESPKYYYLIMEYLPRGTLASKVAQEGVMSEIKARHYFTQITYAMSYLHDQLKISHRDLKAENIMIDLEDNIRIIDFGLSRLVPIEHDGFFSTKCGSPQYAAPELYTDNQYTKAVDVWSLGVILFYMVTGYFPFDGLTRADMARKIINDEVSFPPYLKSDLKDLLKLMLDKNPETRITFEEILKNPWVTHKNKEIDPYLIDFNDDDSIFDRIKKREKTSRFGESSFPSPLLKSPSPRKTPLRKRPRASFLNKDDTSDHSALPTPVDSPSTQIESNLQKSKSTTRFFVVSSNSSSTSSILTGTSEQESKEKEIQLENEQMIASRINRNKRAMKKILSITSSLSDSKINF